MITPHAARHTLFLALVLATPTVAQVNPSGSWRTLHSQHFRIHFRPTYRALAVDAAAEAERAYALLRTELHPPRGVIDLVVSDDNDVPNGYATTYPSNRFTILTVPPVADPGLQNYDSWRRLVIVHELTHVFHLDRSRRLWGTLQSIFGRLPGLFPNQYQPSWVIEGLATYYESKFTAGGRAEGSFHREVVAADLMTEAARSPWDALLFTRWPSGLAPYAYGSRFWDFLAQRAGDSVVPKFSEATAGQLIPFRVGRQLRRAGAPRSLAEEWSSAAQAAVPTYQPGRQGRLIAGELRTQPVPRVAPEGGRHSLAYVYDDGRGARRLRVVDAATGSILRSHRVTGQVSYDWLGDTLIVAQLEYADRWTLRSDLWRWSPDGSWRRMTSSARLTGPRTGGNLLASLRLEPGANAPTLPFPSSPGATWNAVVPSPDGRRIVATRHSGGHWALVSWPAASPDSVAVLAEPPGGVADPTWSGDAVLFVSDVAGFPQILRWSPSGGGRLAQLTDEPLGARTPALLPDGALLFTTLGRGGWELRSVMPRAPLATAVVLPPPAPFDSAPRVAVRETGYAEWPSLRPHFWIPLGFDAGQAGRFFGGATAGVDAIGRYSYFIDGLVSTAPARAQGTFALVTHALGNPTIDALVSNDWSLVGIDSTGHVVSSEHREAALGATVLAPHWRSVFALRVAAEYEGRRYVASPDTDLAAICTGCGNRDRVGGSATISLGSATAAPLAVSLQDGAAVSLLYRRREEQGTARWLNEVRARGAFYARLGPRFGFGYPVLAVRAAIGLFDGPIIDRLSVGGVSSGAAQLGFGQTLGTFRTFPVRGYRSGAARGRRAATLTAEYRVPLTLVGRSLGHLPFGADKFAFALFGDIGDAWDPGQGARLHRLRSVGLELIGDLTVSYDLPLRARLGVAQPASGHPTVYGAFAADF